MELDIFAKLDRNWTGIGQLFYFKSTTWTFGRFFPGIDIFKKTKDIRLLQILLLIILL
jgi:hypothetical protein